MKKLLLFSLIISSIFIFSCNKEEEQLPKDEIIFSEIDKIITITCFDSTYHFIDNYNLSFDTTADYNKQISVNKTTDTLIDCDGGNSILRTSDNYIKVLDINTIISDQHSWQTTSSNTTMYLDEFAGKGEKFIGVREYTFLGEYEYFYRWIKIELSEDKRELKVFNQATNLTESNPIKAGQTE